MSWVNINNCNHNRQLGST